MFSLLICLITLAAIVNSVKGSGGFLFWLWFVARLLLFCMTMVILIPRLTRWFLRRYSDSVMQFIFVMAIMFISAVFSDFIGLEGIFGAFLAGLIMNRYIPQVSPLMNRLEFTGNAIFIPYFLIGVGMLINLQLLFSGGNIIWVVICIVLFGTLGKAAAAYLSAYIFKAPRIWGHMMFGLTSAHAAGAIAMVMVGYNLEVTPGKTLFNDEILNGVVIMILCTCVISTLVTEASARHIRLNDKAMQHDHNLQADDEKILIPGICRQPALHGNDDAQHTTQPRTGGAECGIRRRQCRQTSGGGTSATQAPATDGKRCRRAHADTGAHRR